MDRIALLELNPNYVKMQIVEMEKNKSFEVVDEINTEIDIFKNFMPEGFIKPAQVKEVVGVTANYKRILDNQDITENICIASPLFGDAKNYNSFLGEIFTASTFRFEILTPESEISNLYTIAVNSSISPKAYLINIGDSSTEIQQYNRRLVANQIIIPYGKINLFDKFSSKNLSAEVCYDEMKDFIIKQFDKLENDDFITSTDFEDYEVVGAGNIFRNLGNLSRRAKKYSLDVAQNYEMSLEDFNNVVKVVRPIDASSNTKMKGLTATDAKYLNSGLAIIDAFLTYYKKSKFSIIKYDVMDGILLKYVLPLTCEKPFGDALGFSLLTLAEKYDKKPSNSSKIYELSLMLFKQFKVLHKLPRFYIKVLRIASYLINCGKLINFDSKEKGAFFIIQSSDLYNVSHKEIILAAFTALLTDADSYSPAQFIKYHDIFSEEELKPIRRLATIIKVAQALDVSRSGAVDDITCDILGDSMVVKLVTNKNVSLEIKHANDLSGEFKKYYGKYLTVM